MRKLFYSTALLIVISSFSCDAPRNNPLDPNNPSGLGVIAGTVYTLSLPYRPIEGASVYFNTGDALARTDINGSFRIEKVPVVSGSIIVSKEGYLPDTILAAWNGAKELTFNVNLNTMPVIDSITFYTVVINQYNVDPSYELVIKTHIIDKDNDIDSVYMVNQTYSLKKGLDFNPAGKMYQATINSNELLAANITDIEQLIGEDFRIMAQDVFGRTYTLTVSRVSRVIKAEVENLSPAGGDTTTIYPIFKWNRFRAGYPFTYTINVYTNDLANSQLVLNKENIPADSIQFISPTPLERKEYYWVIWIVDNFQNRSRSKPKTFEVR